MQAAALLSLRRQLTIDEAAQLIAAGSNYEPAGLSALLIEAIEAGVLPARVERWEMIDYFDGNYSGAINALATTVQRADLDDWCQKMGLALLDTKPGQAGGDATATSAAAATGDAAKTAQSTVHKSTKGKPDHPLKAIIEMAREKASDRDNYICVWLALVQLAERPSRPTPLVGYAEGDVKYLVKTIDGNDTVCFSKDALRQWMKREVLRQQGERDGR